MVVAGHDDDGLLPLREVPEARQRLAVQVALEDQVREQALLLVRLRDRHLVEVDPVGLRVARRRCRRTGRPSGSARCRRAPGPTTPGCPGACRRPSARGRR